MSILEARGIQKRFGGVIALSDGNIKCEKGKITGLLGMNGSGKSVISKIITGIYHADSGEIVYDGNAVRFRNPDEARRQGISMAFQNLSLIKDLSVWQNIVLGTEKSNGLFLNNQDARKVTREILDRLLPGMDIERKIYELTPVEMQVVEIAKAVSVNPRVLILDEPTASLEREQVQSLFKYMRELIAEGVAIIFTSHRMGEVMEICDDIVVFKSGATVGTVDFSRDESDVKKIIMMITGEERDAHIVKEHHEIPDDYIFEVNNLRYGSVLQDISIRLKKGEILGIGGLTGQGQHELMLALAGFYKKISCDARVNGENVRLNKPVQAIRKNIMLVPGDRQAEGLFTKHSVFFNMIFPKYCLKKQKLVIPRKKYREECQSIAETLSIVMKDVDTAVDTLSGGNQQKVVVGKWLSFDTKVLLLSDPAKGVDIGAKQDLYKFISELIRKRDMGVILYASDSDELLEQCDRALIMYEGRIVAELAGDRLSDEEIVAASISAGQADELRGNEIE